MWTFAAGQELTGQRYRLFGRLKGIGERAGPQATSSRVPFIPDAIHRPLCRCRAPHGYRFPRTLATHNDYGGHISERCLDVRDSSRTSFVPNTIRARRSCGIIVDTGTNAADPQRSFVCRKSAP